MIISGIDEAGYGPLLGPLVVGCCAFEIDDHSTIDEPPCLWKRLRRHVSKARSKTGRKLHINDSKIVYSSTGGLKELEKSVVALAAASSTWSNNVAEFLNHVAPEASQEASAYAWYAQPDTETFPLDQDGMPIRLIANALRQEMAQASTRCVHLSGKVVFERRFNQMVEATRNKASALFSIAALHLDHLLRTYGKRNLVIICDRQGGREHYGSLLRLMFPEWSLEIDCEADGNSEYRLHQDGHCVRIIFREKAEVGCMSVAVASMLSKYLREMMMKRFNAFWLGHLPGVQPTAGYYGDGTRFLTDIDMKRRELRIPDEHLVRSR
jgi:hypothetical protein